jgi:2,4-dienoyl-CoA reductase-like NADH-dependent reductase (Old Yellow Enzyme family)
MEALGVREEDLEERFVRSSGKGGQHVNKTCTCVQLRHKPSGIEVKCTEGRSQSLNRFFARRLLLERIAEARGLKTAKVDAAEKNRRQKASRSRKAAKKYETGFGEEPISTVGVAAMTALFNPLTINGMTLRNRLIRSATWEGMCEPDGRSTGRLIDCYRTLAEGGVGLIITGYAFVSIEGKQLPGTMGLHSDDFSEEMRELTKAVHEAGGKVCIQLVHVGGQTDSKNAGQRPLAPSSVKVDQFPEQPDELFREEIARLVAAFADAARRARDYGFDAVQLHGAHGYLINQFLSPLTNRRTDEYGGPIENRCRFLLEVYRAVRQAVGNDFSVMIKLNGCDNLEGGLSAEDALYAAKALAAEGIDAIEVSGGTPASGSQSPVRTKIDAIEQEGYNLELAKGIKTAVGCPVFSVGGFRSLEVAQQAIADGLDGVALSRPLIWEPGLPQRWQSGDTARAKCISCNGCFRPGLKEGGIRCVVKDKAATE